MSSSIIHPSLGCSLRGKPSATSVQFRNLKYASIPARFQDSYTLRVGEDGVFDATKFGPSCPQKRGAQAFDLTLIGNTTLPCEDGQGDTEVMNEFESLHANITVLESKTGTQKGLPVFVWVHGGGLSMGSNTWPQYDLQKFVDRSVEIGKPVIAVAMNHRLGLFGFVARGELRAAGNMGFKDQVLAFRWIKEHIAGFGGDPNNITAAGNSAGGISLSTLLCADIGSEGLFERVVIMSGDTTLRKPRSLRWHEQFYRQQTTPLGTPAASPKTKLLHTGAEELAQELPLAAQYCGHIDGTWLKSNPTLAVLGDGQRTEHKPAWCKEFVIGDTAHDGTILKFRVLNQPDPLGALKACCAKFLSDSETKQLLATYRLDTRLSVEEEKDMLLALVSELRFYLPSLTAHRGWLSTSPPSRASRYHFHALNPFDGAWTGLSSHELDVVFLLQNFNHVLSDNNLQIAQGMADRFVGYAYGEGWSEDGKVVVFGPDEIMSIGEEEYDGVFRDGRGKVLEGIGAERLWKVAERWQGVLSDED
jgi:carboxylesterase type B